MFLRNVCYIYAQTTGLPDGMSTYGRVWSVGVQAVRGAAVSVESRGLRLNRQRAFWAITGPVSRGRYKLCSENYISIFMCLQELRCENAFLFLLRD